MSHINKQLYIEVTFILYTKAQVLYNDCIVDIHSWVYIPSKKKKGNRFDSVQVCFHLKPTGGP